MADDDKRIDAVEERKLAQERLAANKKNIADMTKSLENAGKKNLLHQRALLDSSMKGITDSLDRSMKEQGKDSSKEYATIVTAVQELADKASSTDTRKGFKLLQNQYEETKKLIKGTQITSDEESTAVKELMNTVGSKMTQEFQSRLTLPTMIGESLKENIPNMGAVMAGVLGDSPAAMMAIGFMGDLLKKRKEAKEANEQEAANFSLTRLTEQQDLANDIAAESLELEKGISEQDEADIEKSDDIVPDMTDDLEVTSLDEADSPLETSAPESSEDSMELDSPEAVDESMDEVIDGLERIEAAVKDNAIEPASDEDANEAIRRDELANDELNDNLESIAEKIDATGDPSDGGGLFGKLKALFPAVMSFMAILAPFIAPILAIVGVLKSLYDGWVNASERLGRNADLSDKFASAIGMIFENIAGLGDWLAEKLGFQTDFREKMENFTQAFADMLNIPFDEHIDNIKGMMSDFMDYLMTPIRAVQDAFWNVWGKFEPVLESVIDKFISLYNKVNIFGGDDMENPIKKARLAREGETSSTGLTRGSIDTSEVAGWPVAKQKAFMTENAEQIHKEGKMSEMQSNIADMAVKEQKLGIDSTSPASTAGVERTGRIEEKQKQFEATQGGGGTAVIAPTSVSNNTVNNTAPTMVAGAGRASNRTNTDNQLAFS